MNIKCAYAGEHITGHITNLMKTKYRTSFSFWCKEQVLADDINGKVGWFFRVNILIALSQLKVHVIYDEKFVAAQQLCLILTVDYNS